ALVLNIGAGDTDYGSRMLNLDIVAGTHVHVVGAAEALPIEDGSCSGVLMIAVLEYVEDVGKALDEARRVLSIGGRPAIEIPCMQGYHGPPGDWRRYTEQGLRYEVQRHGFAIEDGGVSVGPASALSWTATEFLALLVSGRSFARYKIARRLFALAVRPLA